MTDKIREVADGILAAMRHSDPRPWDKRPDNKRPLGNGERRQVGKRRNRHRRKTSDQVKALRKLGWPARRIAALSEEAATTTIAKGGRYELRMHDRRLERGLPSTRTQDDHDAEVARARLKEIDDDPSARVQGSKLEARLNKLIVNPQNGGSDAMKTYSRKPNARLAARKELGVQAKSGIDYKLVPVPIPGGWRWGWLRIPRHLKPAADKIGTLKALLARKGGVTEAEICHDTGWLPHSARARICGLRKAGAMIETIKASGKVTKYRATVAQR